MRELCNESNKQKRATHKTLLIAYVPNLVAHCDSPMHWPLLLLSQVPTIDDLFDDKVEI